MTLIVFLTCMFLYVSTHITSQSLSTLSVIEDFLSKRPMPSGIASSEPRSQNWVRNLNYYSESSSLSSLSCCCCVIKMRACMSLGLDGSTSASERERLINQFNDPENNTAWIFLLSTRYRTSLSFLLDIYWWTLHHSISVFVPFHTFFQSGLLGGKPDWS